MQRGDYSWLPSEVSCVGGVGWATREAPRGLSAVGGPGSATTAPLLVSGFCSSLMSAPTQPRPPHPRQPPVFCLGFLETAIFLPGRAQTWSLLRAGAHQLTPGTLSPPPDSPRCGLVPFSGRCWTGVGGGAYKTLPSQADCRHLCCQ